MNPAPPPALLAWDAEGLQTRLQGDWPGAVVRAVAQTGSTNSDLLDWARGLGQAVLRGASAPPLQVLLAQSQTAGRGRQGRTWVAQPGVSLTFSIGLPLRPRHGWGALSLVVGEAVARVLQPWPADAEPAAAGRLMIKWPNDLWWYDSPPLSASQRAQGAKVGGILIETQPLEGALGQGGTRWVVIGLGLNVQEVRLEGDDPAPVACIARWQPQHDAIHWWHALVPAVLHAVRDFEQHGFEAVRPAVERRELLIGQPVSLSSGPLREGRCVGLDLDGALRVEDPQGGLHRVVAGEVRVRPA